MKSSYIEPVVKVCRCGRTPVHHLSCDEAHGHEYPKCGVDVCPGCSLNILVCKCKKLRPARRRLVSRAERLHGLIQSLAHEFRGYLPHEGTVGEFCSRNEALSSDTRTRLAFIEDTMKKADAIVSTKGRGRRS